MAKVIDATLKLIDQFTPTLRAVNTAVKSSEVAMKSASAATEGTSKSIKGYGKNLEEMAKINQRTSKSITGMGKSITKVADHLTLLSAGLTGAATAGLKLHADYEDGMAKVSTAIDRNVVSLQGLSDGIRKVSDETGRSVTDLAAAEYQALSANVDSAHATEFMEAATRASIAGFADETTAVDGLTTVINAYGLQTEDVTRISDQMIAAQKLGKTTFDEISQSIGNVATSAHMAGIQTEELLGAIDAITKKGVKTPEAVTQIQGMITAIQKQSDQTKKAAQAIGMDFSEAHLKAVGFANFMQELKEKSGGDSTILTHLFGRVEGVNAFKEITADMNDYEATVEKIKNSGGSTAEAFNAMQTPAQKTRVALNELRNAGMDLGAGLGPLLLRTSALMKSVASWLNQLTPVQKELLVDVVQFIVIGTVGLGVLGKVVTEFGTLFGGITKFSGAIVKAGGLIPLLSGKLQSLVTVLKVVGSAAKMLFANPILLVIMAIIAAGYLLYTHWDQVKAAMAAVWNGIVNTFEWAVNAIAPHISGIIEMFQGVIDFVTGVFTGNWSLAWQGVCEIFEGYFDQIKAICETVLSGIKEAINAVIGGINNVSVDIPSWVPVVGGKHYQPNIPYLAQGTEFWQGGPAIINEKNIGGEVVNLPQGTQVIPHDDSLKEEYRRGKADATQGSSSITIAKLADSIIIREDADIDRIAKKLAEKIHAYAMNNAEGAV